MTFRTAQQNKSTKPNIKKSSCIRSGRCSWAYLSQEKGNIKSEFRFRWADVPPPPPIQDLCRERGQDYQGIQGPLLNSDHRNAGTNPEYRGQGCCKRISNCWYSSKYGVLLMSIYPYLSCSSKQCCGSGRIRNFWSDPDPIRNRNKRFGSGFESRFESGSETGSEKNL